MMTPQSPHAIFKPGFPHAFCSHPEHSNLTFAAVFLPGGVSNLAKSSLSPISFSGRLGIKKENAVVCRLDKFVAKCVSDRHKDLKEMV